MSKTADQGLIKFLKTDLSDDTLCAALRVIEAFKRCESREEWARFPFMTWARLEQLQDYLRLLTEHEVDMVNDTEAKEFLADHRSKAAKEGE